MGGSSNAPSEWKGDLVNLPPSERHRLLAAERRRLVLQVLAGESPPADLQGLATEVAAREAERSTVDAETIKRVVISLHHVHLPALADAGVLEYDLETHWIGPDE